MASVTRPSSPASRPLRSASMRSRGCGMWVNGLRALGGRRLGGAVREHRADAAVDEAVDRALGHARCEVMLWHQSTSVVTPASIWASAPIRLPR